MYVYRCQPVCDKGILERDILAESTDLSETAVANHAFCRVFRRIHQAVRPDDPSVCQYHGRTYDHPRPHLPDLYHGIDGVVGEFRNADRFGAVLELLVACLQAYIFTLLSANYIGLAKVKD